MPWRSTPLYNFIVEYLKMRGGTVKDKELYEVLRQVYGVSYDEMLKALMALEVRGLVEVSLIKEDTRKVSLTKAAMK